MKFLISSLPRKIMSQKQQIMSQKQQGTRATKEKERRTMCAAPTGSLVLFSASSSETP